MEVNGPGNQGENARVPAMTATLSVGLLGDFLWSLPPSLFLILSYSGMRGTRWNRENRGRLADTGENRHAHAERAGVPGYHR